MVNPHELECRSIHSWWSDSNSLGATIPLHTFAKPLARLLHHRQVTALLAKNRDSALSAELLDLFTIYLESKEISVATKIDILRDLEIRAAREEDANIIFKNNGVPTLDFLLSSSDASILEIVCDIFGTLALWTYFDSGSLSAYPFERIVSLSMQENPSVRRCSLNAVNRLIAFSEEAAQAIANAGIISIVTRLLFHSEARDILEQAYDVLNNLARCDSLKETLARSIPYDVLIAAVDSFSPRSPFQNSAMDFFLSISTGSLSSVQAFATKSNLKWLREKLDSPATSFISFACHILGNIAQHGSLAEHIVQLAPCHRLVSLTRHPENVVADMAAYVISQICRVDVGMYSVFNASQELLGSADDAVAASSCRLLGSLAKKEVLNTVIANSTCYYHLMSLMRHSERDVAREASYALSQICRVHLATLRGHSGRDFATQAAYSLSQICRVDIGMHSVSNVLLEPLGSADDEVVASGCRFLESLAESELLNTVIARSTCCQSLVSFIGTRHQNPVICRHPFNALNRLILSSEEVALAIVNAGILNVATRLLLYSEDSDILEQICDLLNKLARYDSLKVTLAGSIPNYFLIAVVGLRTQFQNSVMNFLLSISGGSLNSAQAFATDFNLEWVWEKLDWPSIELVNFACGIFGKHRTARLPGCTYCQVGALSLACFSFAAF
ncbi:hypothetical protein MSAN_01236000 [Mycena sanguinolenta]|uniref:Vacuolar protein 8 n=1 Tax=Mycena sanguinolenta TaxID=230812 RepID=A0A8H6YIL4_9AGAR|nr:hypothetical protein MSAN_01236000 [Mycena sanguinolenta]